MDLDFREQVLAEMIFEETPYYETEYITVPEDGVEEALLDFASGIGKER